MDNTLICELITLCDIAVISREGKLSVIGIFDMLSVQAFPGGIIRSFFVATLKGQPNTEYLVDIKVTHNGEVINTIAGMKTKAAMNSKTNIVLELVNLGFTEAGEYHFSIEHEGKVVGTFILSVFAAKQQGGVKLGGAN